MSGRRPRAARHQLTSRRRLRRARRGRPALSGRARPVPPGPDARRIARSRERGAPSGCMHPVRMRRSRIDAPEPARSLRVRRGPGRSLGVGSRSPAVAAAHGSRPDRSRLRLSSCSAGPSSPLPHARRSCERDRLWSGPSRRVDARAPGESRVPRTAWRSWPGWRAIELALSRPGSSATTRPCSSVHMVQHILLIARRRRRCSSSAPRSRCCCASLARDPAPLDPAGPPFAGRAGPRLPGRGLARLRRGDVGHATSRRCSTPSLEEPLVHDAGARPVPGRGAPLLVAGRRRWTRPRGGWRPGRVAVRRSSRCPRTRSWRWRSSARRTPLYPHYATLALPWPRTRWPISRWPAGSCGSPATRSSSVAPRWRHVRLDASEERATPRADREAAEDLAAIRVREQRLADRLAEERSEGG